MANFIVVVVLLVIIGGAVGYIVKAKKSGAKCIGCPSEGGCSGKKGGTGECSCGCSCGGHSDEK